MHGSVLPWQMGPARSATGWQAESAHVMSKGCPVHSRMAARLLLYNYTVHLLAAFITVCFPSKLSTADGS